MGTETNSSLDTVTEQTSFYWSDFLYTAQQNLLYCEIFNIKD